MLDRFYLIADAAHWLARLLPCGVKLVQLRVKDKSEDEIAREIVEAKRRHEICATLCHARRMPLRHLRRPTEVLPAV